MMNFGCLYCKQYGPLREQSDKNKSEMHSNICSRWNKQITLSGHVQIQRPPGKSGKSQVVIGFLMNTGMDPSLEKQSDPSKENSENHKLL